LLRLSLSRLTLASPAAPLHHHHQPTPTLSRLEKLETTGEIATACYQASSSETNDPILSDTSLS